MMNDPRPAPVLVLLVNTGSPAAPTREAVRAYLAEFLGDRRVVELSPLLWQPILRGLILPRRSQASAQRYRSVWTPEGSPLTVITADTAAALARELGEGYAVRWAMRYGASRVSEELPAALSALRPRGLLVLPLFAQYATQTTEAVYDAVDAALLKSGWDGPCRRLRQYYDDPRYIAALAGLIRRRWRDGGGLGEDGRLLMSFHGIPQASSERRDPYEAQCHETARLLAEALGLSPGRWAVSFQSKFGRARWLEPSSVQTAIALAGSGARQLDVVCPGFAADCLETLEEIGQELRQVFLGAGGRRFRYLPALNAEPEAISCYAELVREAARPLLKERPAASI